MIKIEQWKSPPYNRIINILERMAHSRINNYIAPGLISDLIGGVAGKGQVRMFTMPRDQDFHIAPHSHRFDFACCVIKGGARQHMYYEDDLFQSPNDPLAANYLICEYKPNRVERTKFEVKDIRESYFKRETTEYELGDWYWMSKNQYHSIEFLEGSVVLFLEGPAETETSYFLEPIVNGRVTRLFSVTDWMYNP